MFWFGGGEWNSIFWLNIPKGDETCSNQYTPPKLIGPNKEWFNEAKLLGYSDLQNLETTSQGTPKFQTFFPKFFHYFDSSPKISGISCQIETSYCVLACQCHYILLTNITQTVHWDSHFIFAVLKIHRTVHPGTLSNEFYYIFQLEHAVWLVNFVGRNSLYSPPNFN